MAATFETVTATGLPPIIAMDNLTMGADQAVRTASFTCDPTQGRPNIGDPVQVFFTGELVLTGYVRDARPSHREIQRALTVTVCSRTVDATECSCDHDGGEIRQKDLKAIAQELDKQGIGIVAEGDMPKLDRHKLMTGETLYSTLERRARAQGILISDTPKGKLKLSSKPSGRHSSGFTLGQNIEEASANFTEAGRHSKVKVRGQRAMGTKAKDMRAEGVATDKTVQRDRPLIITHDGEATPQELKKRADWLLKQAAGQSVTASVTSFEWRDKAQKLWTPNFLIPVSDDLIDINGDMLIKTATFSWDANGGTKVVCSLVDPRAMGGENPRGKTSKAYAAPADTSPQYQEEE